MTQKATVKFLTGRHLAAALLLAGVSMPPAADDVRNLPIPISDKSTILASRSAFLENSIVCYPI